MDMIMSNEIYFFFNFINYFSLEFLTHKIVILYVKSFFTIAFFKYTTTYRNVIVQYTRYDLSIERFLN